MYQQRTTEQADAILEHGAAFQRIALRLAQPAITAEERMALGFELHRRALDLNGLSEDVRRGRRPPGKANAPLVEQRSVRVAS